MKKFISVKSGEEIKIGNEYLFTLKISTPLGTTRIDKTLLMTKDLLDELVKNKLVRVIATNDKNKYSEVCEYPGIWINAITNILNKTGWNLKQFNNILSTLDSINPWAATQFILKEIAIELDKKYEDHINKSEEIYAISPQDGRIHKLNKKSIKNYKAFPAFRSIEDAKIACSLIREKLKSIFTNA